MNLILSDQAHAARVLAAITFHFDPTRLGFLAEVLRSLSEFPVAALDVVITTNTTRAEHLALLNGLCTETLPGKGSAIRSCTDLHHPFDLTWNHKAIIAEHFAGADRGAYTHFIYLEDDIRLSFANFCYFVKFREILRNFGLLPSFLRVEYSTAIADFVASDAFWPVYVPVQPHILCGDYALVNMPNPYNPCFILDAELAAEYVRTRSFDREESRAVCRWGVRERAAMGLCLENVPAPFQSRYVVAVARQNDTVPDFVRIAHLPNNYADNPRMPLGKVCLDTLFVGARELRDGGYWGTADATTPGQSGQVCDRKCHGDAAAAAAVGQYEFVILGRADPTSLEGSPITPPPGIEAARPQQLYYLLSAHDTILYADLGSKHLRNTPFGIAPLNLVLDLAGPRARLLITKTSFSTTDRYEIGFARTADEMRNETISPDLDFHIETFGDESIGIRYRGHYLAADLDGLVRNDRNWCRDFERYRLIRADTLDGLELLRRYSWLSHSDRRIVTLAAQPIDFGRARPAESSALAATLAPGAVESRRHLVIGPARVRLVAKNPPFIFDGSDRGGRYSCAHIQVRDDAGALYDFSRFEPLVYYCVHGDDSSYDSLRLSLVSLARFGSFDKTVGVACDRPSNELMKYVPEPFHKRLVLSAIDTGRAWFHQDCLDAGLYDAYQPILYCDIGVIFDASITELLIDIVRSTKMCRAANAALIGFPSSDWLRTAVRNPSTRDNFTSAF